MGNQQVIPIVIGKLQRLKNIKDRLLIMTKKNLQKLNKYQRKLILDMLNGDCSIDRGRLKMKHSIKQEDYVLWKQHLLNNVGIETSLAYTTSKSFGKEYPSIVLRSKTFISIKHMRYWLYRPVKFLYYPSFFKHLDNLSIALWYLDDGSYCKYKNNPEKPGSLRIYTYTTIDVNKVIQNFFEEKYKVGFKIHYKSPNDLKKNPNYNPNLTYLITETKSNIERFLDIVRPYAENIKSLQYKINRKIFLEDCINNNIILNTKNNAVMLNSEAGDTLSE